VLETTEVWSFVQFGWRCSSDSCALVRFQVLDRRPFDLFAYNADKSLVYTDLRCRPPPTSGDGRYGARGSGDGHTPIL